MRDLIMAWRIVNATLIMTYSDKKQGTFNLFFKKVSHGRQTSDSG